MILASKERIEEYTQNGCWINRTLVEDFKVQAREFPERTAIVDPMNKEDLLGAPPDRISYADLTGPSKARRRP